jgi:hypothetical protein
MSGSKILSAEAYLMRAGSQGSQAHWRTLVIAFVHIQCGEEGIC